MRPKPSGAYAAPIRNSVVPHFGHLPFIAGFPFLSFTFFASAISRFARHFTQYAWTMEGSPPRHIVSGRINIWVFLFFVERLPHTTFSGGPSDPVVFIGKTYIMKPRYSRGGM